MADRVNILEHKSNNINIGQMIAAKRYSALKLKEQNVIAISWKDQSSFGHYACVIVRDMIGEYQIKSCPQGAGLKSAS